MSARPDREHWARCPFCGVILAGLPSAAVAKMAALVGCPGLGDRCGEPEEGEVLADVEITGTVGAAVAVAAKAARPKT